MHARGIAYSLLLLLLPFTLGIVFMIVWSRFAVAAICFCRLVWLARIGV